MVPRPMLATSVDELPTEPGWTYEAKWDGDRTLIEKRGAVVRLYTRMGKDVTDQYRTVRDAVAALSASSLVLDGEIVAFEARSGRPSFEALRSRAKLKSLIAFLAFDVLERDGESLMQATLATRRKVLGSLRLAWPLLTSDLVGRTADEATKKVKREGLEGVVAKREKSIYQPGRRSRDWVKVRFSRRQEFVVGGYEPVGRSFDWIAVGYFDDDQRLLAAGRVRAGFTEGSRKELLARLMGLRVPDCPFVNLPNSNKGRWNEGITAEDMAKLQWVAPKVVVEIAFFEWTAGGHLRHASFVAIRDDKLAADVRRDVRSLARRRKK